MKNLYKHFIKLLLLTFIIFYFVEAKAITCSVDTVHYALNKSSGFRAITLGASSVSATAQYYRAPQPITVSGFEFYAYATGTPTITLNCAIYLAAPDSSPTGAPLRTVNITIDSSTVSFYNSVMFTTPVTVTANYVLVVTNPSLTSNAAIICNDFVLHDGFGEYFALGKIGTSWLKGDDIVVGTYIFDADWIIEPYVSYDNLDSIYAPVTTVCSGSPLSFNAFASRIINDDMYNVNAFIGATSTNTFGWTFGDTTLTRTNLSSVNHTYYTPGTYTLTLYDTLRRWRGLPCIGTNTVTINVLPNIVSSSFTNSTGSLAVNFTNTSTSSVNYTWSFGDGGFSTATSPTHTYLAPGRYNVCLIAYNICDSAVYCDSITVTCPAPGTPSAIVGPSAFCLGDIDTFSVTPDTLATSYIWTAPGWTGVSTSNSIILTAGATAGNISVIATSVCGTSAASVLNVTLGFPPATPGAISGSSTYCPGDTLTYSVSPVLGALSYTWNTPGWTGSSTTNSITLIASAIAGNISVIANNNCGSSAASNLIISRGAAPSSPGIISGPSTVCVGDSATYTISPISGVLYYTWNTPGWSGTSTSNSITLLASAGSGNINVTCTNRCGTSLATSKVITVSTIPVIPGVITGATTLVCPGSTQVLSVAPVAGATTYNWILPSGWTGTSTSNSISTIVGTSGGTVYVSASNICGTSALDSITYNLGSIPDSPSIIIGPNSACASSIISFSVSPVVGATSYLWTLPSGWIGSSTTNTITVTTGVLAGTIAVAAVNSCGTSATISLNVTINALSVSISTTPQSQNPPNGTITISAPVGGVGPYQFALDAGPFQNNSMFVNVVSDTHQVVVKDVNGCVQIFTVYVPSTVGFLNNKLISNVLLYPNPVSENLHIHVELFNKTMLNIQLVDLYGNVIWHEVSNDLTEIDQIIDVSNFSKGTYILKLESTGISTSRKIVIQ